jgi:hypothetical protein
MATTISTQDLENARRDIDDIGEAVNEVKIVSPRYGEDFKSIPMLSAEMQDAIEVAAAAGAGANGWTDLLIQTADGSTQRAKKSHHFNRRLIARQARRMLMRGMLILQTQIDQKGHSSIS